MKIQRIVLPACGTNCYIVVNEGTNEAFIVDPGSAGSQIIATIKKLQVKPVGVLLTHGHFDHAGALDEVCKHFSIESYAHEMEKETLESPELNLSMSFFGESEVYHANYYLKDEQEFDLAGFHIRCLFTPGHTPGGCCFYLPYESCMFTGDTLFAGSVGRTDFPKGSMSQLVNSIREKILSLPTDIQCFPGHEGTTTIEEERMYNPFLA